MLPIGKKPMREHAGRFSYVTHRFEMDYNSLENADMVLRLSGNLSMWQYFHGQFSRTEV